MGSYLHENPGKLHRLHRCWHQEPDILEQHEVLPIGQGDGQWLPEKFLNVITMFTSRMMPKNNAILDGYFIV